MPGSHSLTLLKKMRNSQLGGGIGLKKLGRGVQPVMYSIYLRLQSGTVLPIRRPVYDIREYRRILSRRVPLLHDRTYLPTAQLTRSSISPAGRSELRN